MNVVDEDQYDKFDEAPPLLIGVKDFEAIYMRGDLDVDDGITLTQQL